MRQFLLPYLDRNSVFYLIQSELANYAVLSNAKKVKVKLTLVLY